jgi:large subunit ribosomal protein L22
MYKYSTKDYNKENMARAVGINLAVSTKISVEVCDNLRGKNIEKAKLLLNNIIHEGQALPMKKFTGDRGHKRGKGAGRYPIKTAEEFLNVLESVESNAQFKGLNTSNLIISHINAQKCANAWHYGRHRTKMKRTTIEVVVKEEALKQKKKLSKKDTKKSDVKPKPVKKETKVVEVKK